MKDYVKDLYKKLSENVGESPELFHYDYFKLEGGELYYIGNRKPLTTEGKLKSVGMLADILGKNRLCRLGFNIPVGHITAHQAVMLNKAAEHYQDTLSYASSKVDYSVRENLFMLPSNMELKIKTGAVGYNNRILVSNGKFSLGKNDEVNSLETPAIKNHKTNS